MTTRSRVVLATAPFESPWPERLQSLVPDIRVEQHSTHVVADIAEDLWREVEVLYTFSVTIPSPQQAPHLRWVHLYSAGADPALGQPLAQTSVMFTTSSGVHAIPMAEWVLTMMLAWPHKVRLTFDWQQRGEWPSHALRNSIFVQDELWGKTVGIVGYGSIGRHVARLASGVGMRVLAMQRGSDHRDHGFLFPDVGDPDGTLPERYYPPEALHAMLGESDFVVIGVPLTPQTHHLFNNEAFHAMKPGAYLLNIARGDVCDEKALIRALEEQRIAGAALDVFHQEPLPADSPLWHLPNVVVSPHVTGLTPHYNERAATIFVENMQRYLAGDSLYNLVDKARGY